MFDNRPYFKRMNSSIAESISDTVDLQNAVLELENSPMKKRSLLEKTKSVNTPLIKATALGVLANLVVSYFFKDNDMGYYFAEVPIYSGAFMYYYWETGRENGVSRTRLAVDLAVMGITSGLISFGLYKNARYETIDYIVKNGYLHFIKNENLLRSTAAGITQLGYMPIWALILNPLKKGIDYLDNKLNFKNHMVNGADKVTNGIKYVKSSVEEKYRNSNPTNSI